MLLSVFQGGLLNGGNAGLIYGYIFVWIGSILQVLVMAEMASMFESSTFLSSYHRADSPVTGSRWPEVNTTGMIILGF